MSGWAGLVVVAALNGVTAQLAGELGMVLAMLVLLVWLLNREFEINYRLSYHCSLLAAKDRKRILNLKNQVPLSTIPLWFKVY